MENTLNFIKSQLHENFLPEIAVVLGSGLGELADEVNGIKIPYSQIPNFEVSKVDGHKNQLVFATIEGRNVVFMQGRFHFYEGYSLQKSTFPIKVLKKAGVKKIILTNAAGSLTKSIPPSNLMIIQDHINFIGNPLIGINDNSLGTRFPDMSEIYKKYLIKIAVKTAEKLNINVKKGVYCAVTGPSYETPAEVNFYKKAGADVVGMSTAPEAIVANWCGLDVLGISCATNFAAGVTKSKLSHDEVIETTNKVKTVFKKYILELIKTI